MPWTLKFWSASPTPPAPVVTWNLTGAQGTPGDVPLDQITAITNALNVIAGLSTYATTKLNAFPGDIRVGYIAGVLAADRMSADKFIVIDIVAANNFLFFNSFGKLVQSNLGLTIMHELAHIYLNTGDSPRNATDTDMNAQDFDFRGAVIDEQNLIAENANLTDQVQVSYQAAGPGLDNIFIENFSYTDNNEIEIARVGSAGANNIDHSLNTQMLRDLLFGLGGDDTLKSGDGADYVYGGDGEDTIWGGDGNDVLVGEAHDDTFRGDDGDDLIWGGIKDGIYEGTADGTDTVDYSTSTAGITITFDGSGTTPSLTVADGTGGTDTLHSIESIVATSRTDYLNLSGLIPGGYTLTIDMGPGTDVIANASAASGGIVIDIDDGGNGTASTPDGGGTINLLNAKTQIIGSYYDDEITDLAVHDGLKRIDGGNGNDEITVDGSEAMVVGGEGNDIIIGGAKSDYLVGGEGDNQLFGGGGADVLVSNRVEAPWIEGEVLDGGAGSDRLVVQGANDDLILRGGAGNDLIDASAVATDEYDGTKVVFETGDGHDLIVGDYWAGQNPTLDDFSSGRLLLGVSEIAFADVELSEVTIKWDVTITDQEDTEFDVNNNVLRRDYAGIGDLAITLTATGDSILIKNFVGTFHTWTNHNPFVDPTDFDEFVLPILTFSDGSFAIDDGSANVSIVAASVAQYDVAWSDHEAGLADHTGTTAGTSGDDELRGGRGDDAIAGGDGDDSVSASGGNDTIDGGAGNDSLALFGSRDNYEITNLGGGSFEIVDTTGLEGSITASSIESFYFTTDNEHYSLEDLVGYYGTLGNDIIVGSDRDNMLFGLDGDDHLHGLDGDDVIDGGEGYDTAHFVASSLDFEIYYDPYDSSLIVSHWTDEEPYEGNDILVDVEALYFAGDDVTVEVDDLPLVGTAAADTLVGSGLRNRLFGWGGNDVLYGFGNDDSLSGDDGNDELTGGAGNDWLQGGYGDDIYVYGLGDGEDIIAEYTGTDVLVFAAGIAPNDVIVSADGDDFLLSFASASGSVAISGGLTENGEIEEIRFADNTVWTAQDLYDMAFGQSLMGGGGESAPPMLWQSSEPAYTPAKFAFMADFHVHIP